jgi:hypothetical protein
MDVGILQIIADGNIDKCIEHEKVSRSLQVIPNDSAGQWIIEKYWDAVLKLWFEFSDSDPLSVVGQIWVDDQEIQIDQSHVSFGTYVELPLSSHICKFPCTVRLKTHIHCEVQLKAECFFSTSLVYDPPLTCTNAIISSEVWLEVPSEFDVTVIDQLSIRSIVGPIWDATGVELSLFCRRDATKVWLSIPFFSVWSFSMCLKLNKQRCIDERKPQVETNVLLHLPPILMNIVCDYLSFVPDITLHSSSASSSDDKFISQFRRMSGQANGSLVQIVDLSPISVPCLQLAVVFDSPDPIESMTLTINGYDYNPTTSSATDWLYLDKLRFAQKVQGDVYTLTFMSETGGLNSILNLACLDSIVLRIRWRKKNITVMFTIFAYGLNVLGTHENLRFS